MLGVLGVIAGIVGVVGALLFTPFLVMVLWGATVGTLGGPTIGFGTSVLGTWLAGIVGTVLFKR